MYWTSPPIGSGCIDFKAMIVERQDVWYADDGGLTYTMCEDDGPLSEPKVIFYNVLYRKKFIFSN